MMLSSSISARTMRDLADGLQQQMFFWGQDILHPSENIMVAQGFERSPSTGLKGTSCYRKEWQGGHLELYGSTAGWYGTERGFTFIRPRKRCVVWRSSDETPVPGVWQGTLIKKEATREELHQSSLPFLDWLITYESTILERYGIKYREGCYQRYKNIPKAKPWLPPLTALKWLECFRDSPEQTVPPKRFSAALHSL